VSIPPFHDFLHSYYSSLASNTCMKRMEFFNIYGLQRTHVHMEALRNTLMASTRASVYYSQPYYDPSTYYQNEGIDGLLRVEKDLTPWDSVSKRGDYQDITRTPKPGLTREELDRHTDHMNLLDDLRQMPDPAPVSRRSSQAPQTQQTPKDVRKRSSQRPSNASHASHKSRLEEAVNVALKTPMRESRSARPSHRSSVHSEADSHHTINLDLPPARVPSIPTPIYEHPTIQLDRLESPLERETSERFPSPSSPDQYERTPPQSRSSHTPHKSRQSSTSDRHHSPSPRFF
jgi:hypothetical protein